MFINPSDTFYRPEIDIKCNYKWYGNDYGGFYVCPDGINENSIVYSFGIGEDMSFDHDMVKYHHCTIHCFDPTPKSIQWFKKQSPNPKFVFHEFGLSNRDEETDFYLPSNPDHVSASTVLHDCVDSGKVVRVNLKRLNTIMNELGHTKIDVLKMDIEGAEYDVLNNVIKENIPIGQILVEFHARFFKNGNKRTKNLLRKLKNKGYRVFAVSDTSDEISLICINILKK